MKLVADVDTIKSNLEPLTSEISNFTSAVSTFDGASINCTLAEVSEILDGYKKSISSDLGKLNTSSNEYGQLVEDCCSEYLNNEANTTSIDVSAIDNIISSVPDITSDYDLTNAKNKLTGIQIAEFGAGHKDTGNAKVDEVYNTLADKGFNEAAICGILANIEHESGFDTNALGDGGTSYGLCQWHNSRWSNLKSFCSQNGYDPSSMKGQLEYLEWELKNNYPGVYKALQNVPNTSEGAYQAAYEWTINFEIPDNKEARGRDRGNTAASSYWKTYGKK